VIGQPGSVDYSAGDSPAANQTSPVDTAENSDGEDLLSTNREGIV